MKTVGEFDDQDADVGAKSNHQTEEIVASFGEVGVDIAHAGASDREFCDAINKKGNRFAEFGFYVIKSNFRVLDSIMENAGDHGVFVHTPFFENFLHSERVDNEGFAAFSELAFVGGGREVYCFLDFVGHML